MHLKADFLAKTWVLKYAAGTIHLIFVKKQSQIYTCLLDSTFSRSLHISLASSTPLKIFISDDDDLFHLKGAL